MGVNRIAADAQNLGIILLEPAVSLPEQGSLAGSTGSEVKHMERQHHHFLAAILAQGNFPMLRRGQLEIRGNIANCCKHNHTPQNSGAPIGRRPKIIPHNPNFRYPPTPRIPPFPSPHSAIPYNPIFRYPTVSAIPIPAFRHPLQSHIPLSPHSPIPIPAFRYTLQSHIPLPPLSAILIPTFRYTLQSHIPLPPLSATPIPNFALHPQLCFPHRHPPHSVIPKLVAHKFILSWSKDGRTGCAR